MGPIAAMPGAGASRGLADAQARVAGIRERIDGLVAQTGGFALPTPTVDTNTVTPAGAGAVDNPRVVTAGAPTGASTGAPGAGTGVARPGDTAGAAELAAKLPANGKQWAGSIDRVARAAGVVPSLLAALVRHESNFDPNARSHAGAIGLTQLMPGTAAGLNVDPHDSEQNLAGGARFLRSMLDRFGSVELGLAAYNAGPNRVAQAGGIPRITETQNFVQRVTATWEQLR